MKASYRLTNPEEVEATLELTMPIRDWLKLREQIAEGSGFSSYPGWKLKEHIDGLVKQAQHHFFGAVEKDG